MADQYAHLHVHTEYSMLDGAAKNKKMFAEVERLGMPAIAMSDHGNMFGAYDFFQTAKNSPVKPIIGIEAYVAPESRFGRTPVFWSPGGRRPVDDNGEGGKDVSGGGRYTHMTMWAEHADGLRNLFKLSTRASKEGYYMKPRMDRELIAANATGIIATTGCPSGEVQTRLRLGQYEEAVKAAGAYQDIFGKENYFLELMDHGLDIERQVRDGLLRLAKQLGIPLLVTNDSHYVTEDQADDHDNLLCIGVGKDKSDPNRFRFNGSGYYIKSAAEMYGIDSSDAWQEGCRNTLLIAERVQSYDEVFNYVDRMPQFPDVPEGETQESWLRKDVLQGLEMRYGSPIPDAVLDRFETEMKVIGPMGFSSYFLVVADICKYARDNDIIVGPGRGSATGSIVAYATRITELDPLEHGLLFERFLNPERINPPDVDLDFDDLRREDMIRYVTDKYGDGFTAQVNTFGRIKAKNAVKDANRILGYPFAMGDRITKAMPPDVMGKGVPLADLFNTEHKRYAEGAEIRGLYDTEPDVKKIIDTGMGVEGLIRNTGVHAAAVILSSAPLEDLIPLHKRDKDGVIITGFDYPSCEEMGLIKMDFLGVRNLRILHQAMKIVEVNRGTKLELLDLPLDDKPTFELLARGDTLGVFQLDGGPMRQLLRLMEPSRFEDIAAVLALYRPGPMAANAHTNYAHRKNGRQDITPIHPELEKALEPILGTTFHLLVYQEQIMAIARELAGYSLGGADLLRRAMGKKKPEILAKEFANFQAGMQKNGYSDEAIQALWDVMLPFSGYAFNKSHTAGYGMVSYWTAYMKANYPAEYTAALLTSVDDDKDKMAVYLADARAAGIKVLSPDVNESVAGFTAVGNDVRFGLKAVRNVGLPVIESLVETRKAKGKYTSFADFLDKVELPVCNKRAMDSLIKAGAFDSLDHTRMSLSLVFENAIDAITDVKKQAAIGQDDLFGSIDNGEGIPKIGLDFTLTDREWPRKQLLGLEREMLGLYVSSHPLDGAEHILARNRDISINELLDSGRTDGEVKLSGLITGVDRRTNKTGQSWAIVTLADRDAQIEVLFFAKSYLLIGDQLVEDNAVTVTGRVSERDGAISVLGREISTLDISSAEHGGKPPIQLRIPENRVRRQLIADLKQALGAHPGDVPVHLLMQGREKDVLFALGYQVTPDNGLAGEIKSLLGPGAWNA